jgi:RNA polymerase sigma-70 factor (ECF subfamily)
LYKVHKRYASPDTSITGPAPRGIPDLDVIEWFVCQMAPPFHTTSWSLISRTRESGDAAREATAALCRLYWQPLYVYVRRAGQHEHEAQDIVQDFLIHVVEHDVFGRADADRGRFRTFLLSSLQQFMGRRHRDAQRQKRTPPTGLVSMDVQRAEQMIAQSAAGQSSPDGAYERAWALAQIELAWRTVQAEYAEGGKSGLFCALRPIIAQQTQTPVREIAAELNMTEGAINVAAHRLRRRFGEALREQVALTLADTDDVDDEIALLREALAGNVD